MLRIKMLSLLLALTAGICELSASTTTITYVAGNCKPKSPSFPTISAALAASPAPDVVMVCPGTYNEQVEITLPVTLEGISSGDSTGAIIAPPAGGLQVNAMTSFGNPIAAQLWVNNATGPVTITNLTVDGTGNNSDGSGLIVGIFIQNSATTVNRATTRHQTFRGTGQGVVAEGGASAPFVTIENSSIHDFDLNGLQTNTNSPSTAITLVVKNNYIDARNAVDTGVFIGVAAAVTVSNNTIVGAGKAIGIATVGMSTGSISGNTIENLGRGILAGVSGISVTSNDILGSVEFGVLAAASATIQGNTITGGPVGIEFACTDDSNVRSNAINDVVIGVDEVPDSTVISNSYFNVPTIRQGGC